MNRIENRSLFTLFFTALLMGCNETAELPKTGSNLFSFKPQEVTELSLHRTDPESGDRWTATVKRTGDSWIITSSPEGNELLDPLANGTWVNHFIDALSTLKYEGEAPGGRLENLGLAKPYVQVRWKDSKTAFELALGDRGTDSLVFAKTDRPIKIRGAAVSLLNHVETFTELRHHRLANFVENQVAKFEIIKKGKAPFVAVRNSGKWTDANGKPYQSDVREWLDRILHLEIKDFMDSARFSANIVKKISAPDILVTFFDFKGNRRELAFTSTEDRLFARVSTRSAPLFELNADDLPKIKAPN